MERRPDLPPTLDGVFVQVGCRQTFEALCRVTLVDRGLLVSPFLCALPCAPVPVRWCATGTPVQYPTAEEGRAGRSAVSSSISHRQLLPLIAILSPAQEHQGAPPSTPSPSTVAGANTHAHNTTEGHHSGCAQRLGRSHHHGGRQRYTLYPVRHWTRHSVSETSVCERSHIAWMMCLPSYPGRRSNIFIHPS